MGLLAPLAPAEAAEAAEGPWRPRIAVAPEATRSQRVEALVGYAVAQQGSPYTWGGTGPKALGHDCSGLVLAGRAAAGVDPL